MNREISSAATYIASLLVHERDQQAACASLKACLADRYAGHFDLARPRKGSGFRTLHIIKGVPDTLLRSALASASVSVFPSASIKSEDEVCIFVDPGSVAVKIGSRPEFEIFNALRADQDKIDVDVPSDGAFSASSASSASSMSADSSPPDSPRSSAGSPPLSPIRERVALSPLAPSFATVNA
jgi:hypothetical protein